MTEQQITTAPMGHDDPYKAPAVKAELAAKKAAAEAALDKPGKMDQQGLGGAAGRGENRRLATPPAPVPADAWKHDATLRYPKTDEEFAQLVAMACTSQNCTEVPVYSEETSGVWRNVAGDAARPIITTFTVDPRVFDDILKKADQVAYSTDIGKGVCDGDLTIFVREVAREVEYRRKTQPKSPFRKDRFHLTEEGIKVLAEIDAVSDSLGLMGVTELGKARREVLGCPAPDFKGTLDEARARLAAWKDKQDSTSRIVGDKPATAAPLAVPAPGEQTAMLPAGLPAGPTDRSPEAVQKRIEDNMATIDERRAEMEKNAEAFLPPTTLADAQAMYDHAPEAKSLSFFADDATRNAFFRDANPLLKDAGIPASEQAEFMRAALGVTSRKNYTGTPDQAMEAIQKAITERNKEKMEADKARRARAMSLVCPSGNGSIVYKNVRYMRQAQAIEDPEDLTLGLQTWAAWWESVKALGIAPHDSCVVKDTTRPVAPVTAPAQQTPAATPANGDEVKRDKATWLIKEVKVTGDGQKVTYELRPTINSRMGDFQIVTVRNDRDKKALAAALAQSEIDLETLAPGTHKVDLLVAWKHGKETAPNSGKFYRDIVSITSMDPLAV